MTASVSAPVLAVRRAVSSAALAAWLNASLRGGASADDVADAAAAVGLRRVRTGTESSTLLLGLAAFRAQGWNGARLVLPSSGDPSGLPGPSSLNARAVSAGAAFLLIRDDPGADETIALVPCDDEEWPAALVPLPLSVTSGWPTLRQARSEFVTSISGHSSALMELDVAGDARGLREVVLGEDDQPLPALPVDFSAERRELLARARLVAVLAATAQGDDGASVSAAEATSRAAHLRSLVGIAPAGHGGIGEPVMSDGCTLLATVTGRDRPGLTAELFDTLAGRILDVEQVVVAGRLIQVSLIEVASQAEADAVRRHFEQTSARLGLEVDFPSGGQLGVDRRAKRHLVTVLAEPLAAPAVAGISRRVVQARGNIDRIRRTARYPVTALALDISGADPELLRKGLAEEAALRRIDVAVQRSDLDLHGQRLIVMDVDSTLIQDEVIELIADQAGCGDEVASVTAAAMRGELDFATSLRARTALLSGLPETALAEVRAKVRFTPGARTLVRTMQGLGHRIALVSGGFIEVVEPLAAELGVGLVRANRLEVRDGLLTGGLVGPVVDRAGKADALREFAAELGIPLRRTVAIGDGANDLDMLAAAGLGIAFNAKPIVRDQAETSVSVPYLDSVLYLLGYSREDVEAADAVGRG